MRRCPACNKIVLERASYCPNCGRNLKRKDGGVGILILILAVLFYIASVFVFLPGLLIGQLIFNLSLKMGTFWGIGILFSGLIFVGIYLIVRKPISAVKIYFLLSLILFVPSLIALFKGSLFYKKFVYNTWYWDIIFPVRETLLIEIAKQETLLKPPIIALVKVKTANVRKEPNTDSEIITTLKKGKGVRVLVRHKDWTLVQIDNNTEGWIHNSLLDIPDSSKVEH